MVWAVDIPNFNSEQWDEVTVEETREAAIRFAQERFGADENGCICLVSEISDEDDEGAPLDG